MQILELEMSPVTGLTRMGNIVQLCITTNPYTGSPWVSHKIQGRYHGRYYLGDKSPNNWAVLSTEKDRLKSRIGIYETIMVNRVNYLLPIIDKAFERDGTCYSFYDNQFAIMEALATCHGIEPESKTIPDSCIVESAMFKNMSKAYFKDKIPPPVLDQDHPDLCYNESEDIFGGME